MTKRRLPGRRQLIVYRLLSYYGQQRVRDTGGWPTTGRRVEWANERFGNDFTSLIDRFGAELSRDAMSDRRAADDVLLAERLPVLFARRPLFDEANQLAVHHGLVVKPGQFELPWPAEEIIRNAAANMQYKTTHANELFAYVFPILPMLSRLEYWPRGERDLEAHVKSLYRRIALIGRPPRSEAPANISAKPDPRVEVEVTGMSAAQLSVAGLVVTRRELRQEAVGRVWSGNPAKVSREHLYSELAPIKSEMHDDDDKNWNQDAIEAANGMLAAELGLELPHKH